MNVFELIGFIVYLLIIFGTSVLFAYILQGNRNQGVFEWALSEFRKLLRKE